MKNILVIGANSFIAKAFVSNNPVRDHYHFKRSSRGRDCDYQLDIRSESSIDALDFGNTKFDAILFFQGLNPGKNLEESDTAHFSNMFDTTISGPSYLLKKVIPNIRDKGVVIFMNSIATLKGSYDPAYAASKSAINGLVLSLCRAYKRIRFNSVMLGLIEDSPVYQGMTQDFRDNHASKMFGNDFVKVENVVHVLNEIIRNENINNSCIPLHGGYSS